MHSSCSSIETYVDHRREWTSAISTDEQHRMSGLMLRQFSPRILVKGDEVNAHLIWCKSIVINRSDVNDGSWPPPCTSEALRLLAISTEPPAKVAPQGSVSRSFRTDVSV